jgi:glutamate formiminotransferase/formiminotetrahydrofolate cyclodeaminase
MPNPIVECIANYSEARRPEVVEAIMHSIRSIPQVILLDRHSDLDHNRTVLTFVGAPDGIEEAAFRSIATAARLINLDEHQGEHPRIGASDVVPFVPISGVSMQDCVEIARRLGRRVGEELGIPVYLYEEAATRPERQNLENIRRGQYEILKTEIGILPERNPDFGPAKVGTAGATVIGARQPLIAFNVFLTTQDVSIAKKVAQAVRFSSGGLRYVKALGLLVEGRAQVSMNLTNFRGTPLARVVEAVRREAARYGVSIHHSELVGLIPQEALVEAGRWYLQLDGFEPEQILERRLASALEENQTAEERSTFLDALAAATPAPGGGSAAAFSGAASAALVAMVARLTVGRKKYAPVQDQMQAVLERVEALRQELTLSIERDAAAFTAVMDAFRLPKDTLEQEEAKTRAIEVATLQAARVPLEVARMVVEVLQLAFQAISAGNVNAVSDGISGAALARAALTGAACNVRINLTGVTGQDALDEKEAMLSQINQLEKQGEAIYQQAMSIFEERGGLQR